MIRFGYSLESPRAHIVGSNRLAAASIASENMRRLRYRRIGLATTTGNRTRNKAGFLRISWITPTPITGPLWRYRNHPAAP